MANEVQTPRPLEEMLHAAVEGAWKDPARRSEFQVLGIGSEKQLEAKLKQAMADPSARSFDRAPDQKLGETDRSTIVQATIVDTQKREHKVTVVLDTRQDEQGKFSSGTVQVDERGKPSLLAQELRRQYVKGQDPQVLMRGEDLNRTTGQSLKSPISRLDGTIGGFDKPTYERDKQVTPEQQEKADIEAGRAITNVVKPTFGSQGQDAAAPKREQTMIERLQASKEQDQQRTLEQQQKRAVTFDHGLGR